MFMRIIGGAFPVKTKYLFEKYNLYSSHAKNVTQIIIMLEDKLFPLFYPLFEFCFAES